MLNGKKICVVLPAYNAEKTLKITYEEIPLDIVDSIILVDDHSSDQTYEISKNKRLQQCRNNCLDILSDQLN